MAKVGGALGSGTMLVMDESVCAVDFARSVAVFFAHESCGQCTPCREGTPQLLKTLTRIWEGKGQPGDLEFLESLGQTLMDASFCPLGQTAPAPLLSLLKHFRKEFEDHISGKCTHGVCKVD
jgi:NADH-quinone oxidoreductase subunit F